MQCKSIDPRSGSVRLVDWLVTANIHQELKDLAMDKAFRQVVHPATAHLHTFISVDLESGFRETHDY